MNSGVLQIYSNINSADVSSLLSKPAPADKQTLSKLGTYVLGSRGGELVEVSFLCIPFWYDLGSMWIKIPICILDCSFCNCTCK